MPTVVVAVVVIMVVVVVVVVVVIVMAEMLATAALLPLLRYHLEKSVACLIGASRRPSRTPCIG